MEDARCGKRGAPRSSPPCACCHGSGKMPVVPGLAVVLGVSQDQALGVGSSLGNWVS